MIVKLVPRKSVARYSFDICIEEDEQTKELLFKPIKGFRYLIIGSTSYYILTMSMMVITTTAFHSIDKFSITNMGFAMRGSIEIHCQGLIQLELHF